MVFDVIFRYFFSAPIVWGQEVALYTFIWSSFIGASMSIKSKEAVAVTLFVDRLSNQVRSVMITGGLLVSTIFSLYILYLSFNWIINPNILLQKSITTQTPMIYMYLCIPISLLFMSIHFINLSFEALKLTKAGKVIE
nr:TRAP transporter small permease [Oceanobacillus polygoni]